MENTNIQLGDKETRINRSLISNFTMETADSLDALISMVGRRGDFEEEQYNGGFQNMEETGDEEELSGGRGGGGGGGAQVKKRRLSLPQVRSLEKNFEVENKLEPDRKMQLAKELGLQPRQVAVWFQNRRARWKTKQLERDYGVLKLNYDALKSSFDSMQRDNQKLAAELSSLRKKLDDTEKRTGDVSLMNGHCSSGDNDVVVDTKPLIRAMVLKQEEKEEGVVIMNGIIVINERMERSESDSSAILNENAAVTAGGVGNNSPHPIDSYICTSSSLKYTSVQPSSNDNKNTAESLMDALRSGTNNNNNNAPKPNIAQAKALYNPHQCFTIDDNDESCNFFHVDDSAAATLPWWEWS